MSCFVNFSSYFYIILMSLSHKGGELMPGGRPLKKEGEPKYYSFRFSSQEDLQKTLTRCANLMVNKKISIEEAQVITEIARIAAMLVKE